MKSHFLHSEWNNLIMANYVVPKDLLSSLVPDKTELDLFNGEAFVSLVGFMSLNTKILGFSIPRHINFEEVNLRFYVRCNDHGYWKRGTVFIKEIVPRSAISLVANSLYGEKYSAMEMKHFHIKKADELETCYEWKYENKWNKIAASSQKRSLPIRRDSEEEFIAEHYRGYTKYNENETYEYEVNHPRWELFKVLNYTIDCDFNGMYGNEFSFLNEAVPSSVFMAKGSEVKIYHKKNLN